ncbi:MAG: nucleoside-diphosphate sugar epimerase/dehydratase [Ginsengibacter sp.]
MIYPNPVQKFYRLIKNKSTLPRWAIFILDLTLCAFALFYAYLLRFNMDFYSAYHFGFGYPILIITFLNIIAFRILRTSEGIIRLSGAQEGLRVVTAVFVTTAFLFLANALSSVFALSFIIPTSVLFIYLFTASFLLFAYRLLVKQLYYKSLKLMLKEEKVLIYGKTENALMLKIAIESIDSRNYKVAGFLVTDENLWGKSIDKARLFGFNEIENVVSRNNIKEIFLSSDDVNIDIKTKLADYCLSKDISIKVIPAIEKWVDGHLQTNQLKKLKIEDLLNRPSIKLPPEHIREAMKGKRVLVTGAAGSIGSEIVKQLAAIDVELLILCDNRETGLYELHYELQEITADENIIVSICDIRSYKVMQNIFETYKPEIIFHAAAYKHVPLMEMHACQAVKNNVLGTKNLADLSVLYGVERFVFISTDKAVNPTNVMGASKRIAEMYVAELQVSQQGTQRSLLGNFDISREIYLNSRKGQTKFITTRFGNVLGSNGSVIPRFTKQIETGGPITVTHPDITRYFMTIPESCSLVLEAATMGHGGEIFVFDMGDPVKIVDLACRMIKLSGMTPNVEIKIQYSGLRPGEKLYEELLNKEEEVMPTYHKKIMISKVKQNFSETFKQDISKLISLADNSNNLPLVREMKKIVPEYKSENSQYEKLDIIDSDVAFLGASYNENNLNAVFQ